MRLFLVIAITIMSLALSESFIFGAEVSQTVIEGTIVQASNLPNPKTNPYSDCYYTVIVESSHIVAGKSMPQRFILVLPGFLSREYAPEAKFKKEDKIRATVVPFSSMPYEVKQIQQADDIEDVELEFYFPEKIENIKQISPATTAIQFTEKKLVTQSNTSSATDTNAQVIRSLQIQNDLTRINELLKNHSEDWSKWYKSLERFRSSYTVSYESKAGRWIGDSFFSAGYFENGHGCSPDFVDSVIRFKKYLSAHNVDLILVRVPKKGEIVDDLFSTVPDDGVTNPYLLKMYKELLEADVEIIADITSSAKKQRLKFPLMYWYQDFNEDHPAEGISWVIAEELAKRVNRYEQVKAFPKRRFTLDEASASAGWLGHKWPAGNPKFSPSEFVRFKAVMGEDGKPLKLKQGTTSPVVILGSSFIATPSMSKGATIPHYFACLTGVIPDLVYRNDADFMMPRSVAREGDSFLRNRSVFLFPFTPFTPYKALASIPIVDPQKSAKLRLSCFKGPELKPSILLKEGSKWVITMSSDTIDLVPPKSNADNSIRMEFTLPASISKYKHCIVSLEFEGKDKTIISAKYSGQNETIKRSDTQENSDEYLVFRTGSDSSVLLEFTTDGRLKAPVRIKSISVYGVEAPAYYADK